MQSNEYLAKLNNLLSLVKTNNFSQQLVPDPANSKKGQMRKSLKVWNEKAVNIIYSGVSGNGGGGQ